MPSPHFCKTCPGGNLGCLYRSLPHRLSAFPEFSTGSASTSPFSGPAQRSLALRPVNSPGHLVALYTEGFSRFSLLTTAPIATGWSDGCRVGLPPTGTPCLSTAHKKCGLESPGYRQTMFQVPQQLYDLQRSSLPSRAAVFVELSTHDTNPRQHQWHDQLPVARKPRLISSIADMPLILIQVAMV